MKYASSNTYEGQWVGDKKCGRGLMLWIDKDETYAGRVVLTFSFMTFNNMHISIHVSVHTCLNTYICISIYIYKYILYVFIYIY
jgi:hypothetical protein